MRYISKLCLIALFSIFLGACQNEEPPQNAGTIETIDHWPSKKISHIIYSVGSFDYITYDFTWEQGLLRRIHSTLYDGVSTGGTIIEYEDGRIHRIYPYDGDGVLYEAGAITYHYSPDGRLERQTLLLPLYDHGGLCGETYSDVVPCEMLYSYADDGRLSQVTVSKTMDNNSIETFSFDLTWQGSNVVAIAKVADGETTPIFSGMQYDDHPNPMGYPMGIESMGIAGEMVLEAVWGNSYLFLAYAICMSTNNMTTLISGNGNCSYAYDNDGFPTAKTITANGSTSTYTFIYE